MKLHHKGSINNTLVQNLFISHQPKLKAFHRAFQKKICNMIKKTIINVKYGYSYIDPDFVVISMLHLGSSCITMCHALCTAQNNYTIAILTKLFPKKNNAKLGTTVIYKVIVSQCS